MEFKGELNKSNKEDLIISSGGILFNIIMLIVLYVLRNNTSISHS